MAEKNEKKNEAEVLDTPAPETVNPENVSVADARIAEFVPSGWEDQDEESAVREGTTTVFKTSLKMFRKRVYSEKMKRYYFNYCTGMMYPVAGEMVEFRVNLNPYPNHAGTHAILEAIMGEENVIPLEVVKTTQTFNNQTTENFKFRVAAEDENGVNIACELRPDRFSGGEMTNNLLAVLRSRGEIK